tara:strand:- start:2318 stop:2635 length:318 start_codon:yes stop_codon:yes gene_type:complete
VIKDKEEGLMKAIEEQVGGDHYTSMKRQPIEKTYDTYGYEGVKHSIYTKVDKYLTRDKGTDRVDLCKAIHCLELQLGFYDLTHDDTLDVLQSQFTFEPIDKEGNL